MKTTIVACFLLATATYCDAQVVFTDWTTVDTSANVAVGSLNSASVAFTGSDINFGVTDGSFTGFNFSFFDPPLATSDVVEFKADPSVFTYTISLSLPLTNPRLHLASLGSALDFSPILQPHQAKRTKYFRRIRQHRNRPGRCGWKWV